MSHSTPLRTGAAAITTLLVVLSLDVPPVLASFHLIDVNEVYTNAQGNVQFVELRAYANFQTNLGPTQVQAWNADSTATRLLFDFTAAFGALDNNETVLLATAAFQDTAGFAPDFVMADSVFFPSGRVGFRRDSPGLPVFVDPVAYGAYTGANGGGVYGAPAESLPADGYLSLTRIDPCQVSPTCVRDNALDWDPRPNSPTRNDGMTTILHDPTGVAPGLPAATIVLGQNRPNPASSSTLIPFRLAREADVTLQVFGVDGRLVRTVRAGRLPAGPHALLWDGTDGGASPASNGVYLYRLTADGVASSRQMLLVR
jgi:hypothetical protein